MNFIETLRSVVESAESSYNERDRKIDIYCESVNDQLAIDLKKAELFVMKESGTDEDLAYLEGGAIAEAGERLVEAIKAIIESIRKFIHEMKIKAMAMVSKIETKKAIEVVEKKVKFNPFIRKKKVETEDHDKKFKAFEELLADAKKLLARIKAGRSVDVEDVEMIAEKIEKRDNDKFAKITLTLDNALASLKKQSDKIGERIDDVYKNNIQPLLDDAKDLADKAAFESTAAIKKLASTISRIGTKMTTCLFQSWSALFSAIRETISGIKEKIVNKMTGEVDVEESVAYEAETPVAKESTPAPDEQDPGEQDPIDEKDVNATSDSQKTECGTKCESVTESSEEYFKALSAELFGDL